MYTVHPRETKPGNQFSSVTGKSMLIGGTYLDSSIMTGTDQSHLIASDTPNTFQMSEERPHSFPRVNIPHLDSVIEASGDKDGFLSIGG